MPQNQQPAQNQTPVVSPSGGAVVSTTPAASLPTVNPNAAFQNNVQAPAAAPTPAQTPAPVQVNVNPAPQEQPKPATNAPGQSLAMPATGSVVDLLNAAGQDSSFAARQKLAQQYGIQGYTGTAAQNIELSKKYQEAYNANKSLPVPQTGAEARAVLGSYFDQTPTQQDPQKSFFDEYMAMNPVVKTMYDTINQQLSSTVTQQTFTDEYNSLLKEQGIPALQTELMNIRNIMDGTEDDIRNEITKAGGFATDSQVMAISAARNKTLLKQANVLQNQLQMKEDYVNQIMQFSQLDRKAVNEQVDRKLGLTQRLADIQDKISSAAQENYQKIVDKVGYSGLAEAVKGNTYAQALAERSLGLPTGTLSNAAFLSSMKQSGSMTGSIQEYEYATSQGYTGSFVDYQNEDANRKRSIAAAGVGGLSAAQINSSVNQIAGAFDNEPIVKEFNTIASQYALMQGASDSPTDDISRVYVFAKVMDPNSVVREGEYNTVQAYAQAVLENAGLKAKRVFENTGFLTPEARKFMQETIQRRYNIAQSQYSQLQNQYQRQINDAYSGKPRTITNYAAASPVGDLRMEISKGDMEDSQYVAKAVQASGWKYTDIISNTPKGEIPVVDNRTGLISTIDPSDFNSSLYTKL